jgi:hypothetical protein
MSLVDLDQLECYVEKVSTKYDQVFSNMEWTWQTESQYLSLRSQINTQLLHTT